MKGIIAVVVALYVLSFVMTAGLIAVICWAFGFTFSWKLAIGIWCLLAIAKSVFNVTVKK